MTTAPALTDAHLLLGMEQQAHLAEFVGEQPWSLDLDQGVLRFGDALQLRAEVLGSWAEGSETLLWAWANHVSDLPAAAVAQSRVLRSWGEASGEEVLTADEVEVDADDALELMLQVAGALPDVRAIYRGPHEGGAVFIAITDDQLALPPPETARVLRLIVQALPLGVLEEPTTGVQTWLAQRGFDLRRQGNTVAATHADGAAVILRLDGRGVIDAIRGG